MCDVSEEYRAWIEEQRLALRKKYKRCQKQYEGLEALMGISKEVGAEIVPWAKSVPKAKAIPMTETAPITKTIPQTKTINKAKTIPRTIPTKSHDVKPTIYATRNPNAFIWKDEKFKKLEIEYKYHTTEVRRESHWSTSLNKRPLAVGHGIGRNIIIPCFISF